MQTDAGSISPPRRWPRGQKFRLSAAGVPAEVGHREAVATARAGGRSGLAAALGAWALPLGVQPGDGVVLVELRERQLGLNDLAASLEAAGIEPAELKAIVDRLVSAGLVEPASPPARAA